MMAKSKSGPIRTAGCVVFRSINSAGSPDGDAEVLLVHRAKYDDWTFPKGHVEEGETEKDAAIRETWEEAVAAGPLLMELPTTTYPIKGRTKTVRWWLMRCEEFDFTPNSEVDQVMWVALDEVADRLSYDNDRRLYTRARVSIVETLAANA